MSGDRDSGGAASAGHNSGIAAEALRSFIERIYAEAKSQGFDPKIMRQVIRLRKMEEDARKEQEALIDLYAHALGMERG